MAPERTYRDAIEAWNSLRAPAAIINKINANGYPRLQYTVIEAIEYLDRIGYTPTDLNELNVIHVAGTKGKGSTCAFTESIIRHALPGLKTGFLASPSLVEPGERIRINGSPISEDEFTLYFFEVWDRLGQNDSRKDSKALLRPMHTHIMTILAFHVFLSLKVHILNASTIISANGATWVDVTVLETGVGGAFDMTNVVPKPVATGITSLGLDHIPLLGRTLSEITWHKAGIFKEGAPAFSVPQPEDAMAALKIRVVELKASSFTVVDRNVLGIDNIELGIPGKHQIINATLAVHLAHAFISKYQAAALVLSSADPSPPSPLPVAYAQGLGEARLPGRCQIVLDPIQTGVRWFFDIAHTVESITYCAEWFMTPGVTLEPKKPDVRVLVFHTFGIRQGALFVETLLLTFAQRLKEVSSKEKATEVFDLVIFCTDGVFLNGYQGEDEKELVSTWSRLAPSFPSHRVRISGSGDDAAQAVRNFIAEQGQDSTCDILVTGGSRVVGGMIRAVGLVEAALM